MMASASLVGGKLDATRADLAAAITNEHYRRDPELLTRYGERGRQKCLEDATFHLRYLAETLTTGQPQLFRDYVGWVKIMLAGRGISAHDLKENLLVLIHALRQNLTAADADEACGLVYDAIDDLPEMDTTLPSFMEASEPLEPLARTYLAALLAMERHKASCLIMDAVASGTSIEDLYIHVFARSQHEIGRLWQINQITVAQEHYCTAATQMIMSQLYPQIFAGPRIGRRFVGFGVGGDLHEIGIRIVADFFELAGWDTLYLGANVPQRDVILTLEDRRPDVVGISVTITANISSAVQVIEAIRATPSCAGVKIIVGGAPFSIIPGLWRDVGADGTCLHAKGVVEVANRLLQKTEGI